jgi:imidazolonepropionase-like amidohydrolase
MWKTAASGGTPTEIRFTADLQIKRARRSLPPAHFPMAGQTNVPARGFTGLAISPDGRRIAMLALGKLWIIQIGQAAQAVADVPFEASTLAWSPDGVEVAWSAGVADKEDLFATKVDNGATRQLTALPGRESYPVFSPDGRYVAFVHMQGEEGKLRTIDATANKIEDPGQTRDLGSIGSSGTCTPQWSPASDGLLVCGEARPDQLGRATFVPLTGERQTITKFPNGPIFLQWMADDKIFFERHDRLWQSTLDRKNGTASEPQPLGASAALYLSSSRDGTLLFVSKGGLRLRSPNGQEQELGWPITYSPPVPPPLLIRNVHVIDGTGAPATSARDILIERGRISRIAAANEITPPAGATVLDAAGRFVIPGLIDLHAHVYRPNLLPGWAYFGITTIRDQGSSIGPLVAVADNIASGAMPGPRVAYGGFQFYSDWAFDEEQGRGIEPEADADHIKRSVDLLEAFGAQHIKTRTFRRWDINARMIAEAHSRGLRATGHCSHLLPLIAAGMDAKEHIGGCEARGDKHMYDDMIQLFKAAGIGVVPTVSYLEYGLRVNENPALIEADGEVNPFLPSKESFEGMTAMPAELREVFASGVRNSREGALRLSRAGVTIGTGTDIWLTPVGVHIELEELAKAGLTPAQAIRAGTSDAARILGADNELGTIKIGMVADLVLLDAILLRTFARLGVSGMSFNKAR